MAGSDFANQDGGASARSHFTVVPSDTVDFGPCRAVRANTAGVIALVDLDGTVYNYTVVAGEKIEVQCKRVNATNTTVTAGNIAGWR